jgi:hypothetical protein
MTIDGYLAALERELRRKHAPSRRLLAEAADHLRSSADELCDEGLRTEEAERTAVARFGAAAIVAERYALAVSAATARRAVLVVAAAFAAYAAATLVLAVAAPSWLVDFPQGVPSFLALQVAFVALGLSALRALGGKGRVRLVASGVAVAAGAVAAAAAAELVLALTRPAPAPWHDAFALLLVYAVAACAAVAALPAAVRALRRTSGFGSVQPADVGIAAYVATHPLPSCALVAATAGAAAFAGTGAAGALVEVAAVVAGFLALGRTLGLRPA